MKGNCYTTTISWENALREDWEKPTAPDGQSNGIWHYHRTDGILRKEWIDEWKDRGVHFTVIMLFWRPAWFLNKEAHVDIFSPRERDKMAIGAFNAVIGGAGSQMLWFDMPKISEKDYRTTMAGTSYLSWPIKNLRETERREIIGTNLSLVRVNVPHAIYVGQEPRWCISLRTADMMSFPSWDAMVDSYMERGIIKN